MKYAELIKVIDATSQKLLGHAAAVVNQSLVIRNWLVGAYIVEFEQHGNDRAKYGARLLESLGRDLKTRRVKGMGVSILERSRRFYLVYPEFKSAIPQALLADLSARRIPGLSNIPDTPATESALIPYTASTESSGESGAVVEGKNSGGKSGGQNLAPLRPHALLRFSWSHWSELIRLDDPLKRAFYENECLKGNWSVRQLQRQIGSLLYERTGLSSNKAAVLRRARRQEPKAKMEEWIRDPYVFKKCIAREDDHPPVGILLCSDRESTKVEFATSGMDNKLFVSRYLIALPSSDELQNFLEQDRAQIEAFMAPAPPPVRKKISPSKKRAAGDDIRVGLRPAELVAADQLPRRGRGGK